MNLKIAKFNEPTFGDLTTVMSIKTGKVMFLAKEAAEMWGHTNITQACKRLLDKTEMLLIEKSEQPLFFKQLDLNNVLRSNRTQRLLFITESGLYKLALASNLKSAEPFRDWVTKTVLPEIRETGAFQTKVNLSVQEISAQIDRKVQLENSKKANHKNYATNGVAAIIEYNKENCKQVTGLEPSQIKKIAGKKSVSAKEILRKTHPELAATMSLNDYITVNNDIPLSQLKDLDKAFTLAFKETLKIGINITD